MNFKSAYLYIIVTAISLTLYTNFGDYWSLELFLIIKPSFESIYSSLESTYIISNEWWRLITPTFLHFSMTHLAFNCLWIYVLGSKIEHMDGIALFLIIFFWTLLTICLIFLFFAKIST